MNETMIEQRSVNVFLQTFVGKQKTNDLAWLVCAEH